MVLPIILLPAWTQPQTVSRWWTITRVYGQWHWNFRVFHLLQIFLKFILNISKCKQYSKLSQFQTENAFQLLYNLTSFPNNPMSVSKTIALTASSTPNPASHSVTSFWQCLKMLPLFRIWLIYFSFHILFMFLPFFYIFSLPFQKKSYWIFTNIIPWFFPLISRNNITTSQLPF